MIKLAGKIARYGFDSSQVRRSLHATQYNVCQAASRLWVRKMLEETPKYTGQSWAAIEKAANLFGISVDTSPVDTDAQKLAKNRRYSKSNVGFANVNGALSKSEYSFQLHYKVPQMLENEFGPGGTPIDFPKLKEYLRAQPWRAMEKANKVWNDYVQENFIKIDHRLAEFITVQTVRVG